MEHAWLLALGLVVLACAPPPRTDIDRLRGVLENRTLCAWDIESAEASSGAATGKCDSIEQYAEVSASGMRGSSTSAFALAEFDERTEDGAALVGFLRQAPSFAATEAVWAEVGALNPGGAALYLKLVEHSEMTYDAERDLFCHDPANMPSSGNVMLYFSNSAGASLAGDVSLPQDLTQRVIDALVSIINDPWLEQQLAAVGEESALRGARAMFETGYCGRFLGPSFGQGGGVDRWEGYDGQGNRMDFMDSQLRFAASPAELELSTD